MTSMHRLAGRFLEVSGACRVAYLCAMLAAFTISPGLAQSPAGIESPAAQKEKTTPMSQHARGTFEVKVQPKSAPEIPGVSCFSIDKTVHGDLEATTRGEMFTAGDPKSGSAGYVALELVTGTLAGRSGSFLLQHFATMDASGHNMIVKVTPGSGTSELKGIEGTFTIIIADGKHSYDFEYKLPAK